MIARLEQRRLKSLPGSGDGGNHSSGGAAIYDDIELLWRSIGQSDQCQCTCK